MASFSRRSPTAAATGWSACGRTRRAINVTDFRFSPVEIADYAARNRTLAGLAEYHSMWFVLLGKAEPERVQTGVVAANFFDVLGVEPLLGRTFRAGRGRTGRRAAPRPLLRLLDALAGAGIRDRRADIPDERPDPHRHRRPPADARPTPTTNDVYMPVSACPFRGRPEMYHDRTTAWSRSSRD